MTTNLSHSAIRMYTECARKYKLHYIDKLRSINEHGALVFGRVLDHALNTLLLEKDLDKAKAIFEKSYRFNKINNIDTYIPKCINVVYADRDFDKDLLFPPDLDKIQKLLDKYEIKDKLLSYYKLLVDKKSKVGFKNLSNIEKELFNYYNWFCVKNKGLIMLESYYKKVLPRIKKVIEVQKTLSLTNDQGDKIKSILDIIVEWEDGKRYIIDNKTSYREYEKNSAMQSQQLMIYYHQVKNELDINGGVGFIVLYKQLNKNKEKICFICNYDGSGSRFKTCNNEIDGKRCNGDWIERINPEARIDTILNEVKDSIENLVMETVDCANEGIKAGHFGPNLNACGNEYFKCQYFNLCHFGDDSELINMKKKED